MQKLAQIVFLALLSTPALQEVPFGSQEDLKSYSGIIFEDSDGGPMERQKNPKSIPGTRIFGTNFDSENGEEKFVKVDGEDYPKDQRTFVTILKMDRSSGNIGNIDFILNFPNLESLYIEKYNLTKVPVFANLPKLQKVSLMENELETISNGTFAILRLEELYLARNRIKEIYDQSFGPIKEIFLTCNRLVEISPKWFRYPEKLERLHLPGNLIKILKKDTFKAFPNLKHLDLRQNQLTILEDNSLAGVHSIQYLKLGYNFLQNFSGKIFGSTFEVFHLTNLELRYNNLSFLDAIFFEKVRVKNFDIWANPWQCACKKEIKNWWEEINYKDKDLHFDYDTPCISPPILGEKCLNFKIDFVFEEFRKIFRPIPLKLC